MLLYFLVREEFGSHNWQTTSGGLELGLTKMIATTTSRELVWLGRFTP